MEGAAQNYQRDNLRIPEFRLFNNRIVVGQRRKWISSTDCFNVPARFKIRNFTTVVEEN